MLDAWVKMHLSDNNILGYEKLLKADIHLVVSMMYASGKRELMPLLIEQMVWFFVLDNYFDDPTPHGS